MTFRSRLLSRWAALKGNSNDRDERQLRTVIRILANPKLIFKFADAYRVRQIMLTVVRVRVLANFPMHIGEIYFLVTLVANLSGQQRL